MNRRWRIVLIVLVVLALVRLALPYAMTRYVNSVLSDLGEYRGAVQDVDIHLFRGAYHLDSLEIFKRNGNSDRPFIQVPMTEFSIEWPSVLSGAFVGEVTLENPVVNFIGSGLQNRDSLSAQDDVQTGKEVNWREPLEKLMPLEINRISVHNGKVVYHDLTTQPNVNVFLQNVHMDALNLTNVKENPEELPSRVYLQALSVGNGQLNVAMKLNATKKTPDIDMDLQFENVDMKALNGFFKAYADANIREGTFNLYSELSVKDGAIAGYIKPLFNGLKLPEVKSSQQEIEVVWETMVEHLAEVFEKQKKDQFATRVVVEGDVEDTDSPFWPTVWEVFSDAFADAFDDGGETFVARAPSVRTDFSGAAATSAQSIKSKKEIRKQRRKEKREQRRRERKDRQEKSTDKADKGDPRADSR